MRRNIVRFFLITCLAAIPQFSADAGLDEDVLTVIHGNISLNSRLGATDRLIEARSRELMPVFIDLIQSTEKTPVLLLSRLSQAVSSLPPDANDLDLLRLLKSPGVSLEKRKFVLWTICKKSPQTGIHVTEELIFDRKQNAYLRAYAVGQYRALASVDSFKLLVPLLSQPRERVMVRLAILYALQDNDFFTTNPNLLFEIFQEPGEDPQMRKAAMRAASKIFPEHRWQEECLRMIENRRNTIEMRALAIDYLKVFSKNPLLVNKLRAILKKENHPELVIKLQDLTGEQDNRRVKTEPPAQRSPGQNRRAPSDLGITRLSL